MRILFSLSATVAALPFLTLGVFNGLTALGLVGVAISVIRIIHKEGLR